MSAFISETLWTAGMFGVYVRIAGFTRLETARRFGSTRARLRRDQERLFIEDRTGRSSTRVRDCNLTIVRRKLPDGGTLDRSGCDQANIRIRDFNLWPELERLSLVAHVVRAESDSFLLSELL